MTASAATPSFVTQNAYRFWFEIALCLCAYVTDSLQLAQGNGDGA